MTNVAKPNGTSEKDMAGVPGMTAVHTAPAEIFQGLLGKWKENKVTTFANEMPCGHILYIQAAMSGKKQSTQLPPVTLSSLIDFYAQINDVYEHDKLMEPVRKEGNNHKPQEGL